MIRRERLTEQFCRLVSIDAPSYGERQMGDYLRKKLESLGFTVEEDRAGDCYGGNCGNLYAHRKGKGNPLLLSMHMDTVEPSGGKRAIVHPDGRITSDGTTVLGADDMSGVAAVLEALQHLKEETLPTRELEILFSIGEEKHVKGAKVFDFSKIRAKDSIVLDMSGEIGTAAIQAPSQIAFTVTIHGRASHAGFAPQDGVHAILIASNAVARMPMGRVGEDTTVNIGRIQGGLASNIVPETCTVLGELRSFSHEKALAQLSKIKEIFEKEASVLGGSVVFAEDICYCAYRTAKDARSVREFREACLKTGVEPVFRSTFGGSDQNKLSEHGITGIVMASAMHQVHSCQEYTSVDELEKTAEIVSEILQMTE